MKKETLFWIFLSTGAVLFSCWLMFHTFSFSSSISSMVIASKAWSDFGAHIPLIRSFSLGHNWPPEYPLFPGEPIRYHFLFYFLVGMLEKAGLRIDWALNIPSMVGFAGLLIGIAIITQKLFHDKRITVLSVLFFLCNGSLSFLRFFAIHPLSWQTLTDIMTNTVFPSFAPWGEGDITAFWNLNIYTNQRHLAPSFSLALLFIGILLLIEKKPWKQQALYVVPEVVILAFLPYFHQPMLIILALFMICYFLLFPKLRIPLLLIGGISVLYIIPQIIPLLSGTKTVHWEPGYLLSPPLTPIRVVWYWIQNLGLHVVLIPLGFILAPKQVKKITSPLLFLFLIPNLFQFSIEMAANHKFFNFYLVIGNMLSSFALISVFDAIQNNTNHLCVRFTAFVFLVMSICILTLSGIIDLFPIINDEQILLPDIPTNAVATWIRDNTPPDAVFLNSSYFFHPASIAGRKIFYGWPYFAWSAGYDSQTRNHIMTTLYESRSREPFCQLANQQHLSYMTIERVIDNPDLPIMDPDYFLSIADPVFTNNEYPHTLYIFSIQSLCER